MTNTNKARVERSAEWDLAVKILDLSDEHSRKGMDRPVEKVCELLKQSRAQAADGVREGSLNDMPKDGSPFLALVNDWYGRKVCMVLLKMNLDGNWIDSAYAGDQTFDCTDVLKCWNISSLNAPEKEVCDG